MTISVWRQDFSRNVGIGSSSQDLLETSVRQAGLNNWIINITTRSRTWERSINLGDLILEMFGKELQSELV